MGTKNACHSKSTEFFVTLPDILVFLPATERRDNIVIDRTITKVSQIMLNIAQSPFNLNDCITCKIRRISSLY